MKIVFVVLILFSLSGCVDSDNPVCEGTTTDAQLSGVWNQLPEQGNRAKPGVLVFSNKNEEQAVKVKYMTGTSEREEDQPTINFTLCRSPSHHYVNLRLDDGNGRSFFNFYRYEVSENASLLKVYGLKHSTLKKAVTQGLLNGKVWETTWGEDERLTSSSEKIYRWIEKQSLETAFEMPLVFRKAN